MSNKLTLDYGLRFVYMQPTYDTRIQASTFFLDRWQASQAPLLYVTGCAGASPVLGHQPSGDGSPHRPAARARPPAC